MFLHFFLYGCNIFAWRKTRINYSFIFELSATKELKYRDVFLICTTSMTAVIGVMFVHLALLSKGYSYTQVQVIPGLLLLVISQHDAIFFVSRIHWASYLIGQVVVIWFLTHFLHVTVFLAVTCVPLQHLLSIKPLPFHPCDEKYSIFTSLQGKSLLQWSIPHDHLEA